MRTAVEQPTAIDFELRSKLACLPMNVIMQRSRSLRPVCTRSIGGSRLPLAAAVFEKPSKTLEKPRVRSSIGWSF